MASLAGLLSIVVTRMFLALVIPPNHVLGLYIPGYGERSVLHVCSGETKNLVCQLREFMWVHSVIIGYSPTDPTGCSISSTEDCQANLIDYDYWRATSYQQYSGVTVPDRTVTCADFTVQYANYVVITYSCVSEALLAPASMDICRSASQTMVEGHLTNPRWALGVGRQTLDCTCLIEPAVGSTISATLALLYTDLPEQIPCGEEASIEDQDGNILLQHCSPGWLQHFTSPASKVVANTTRGTRYVRVHFVKDYTNDFPPRMTKLWYGFEASGPVQVTCGPTGTFAPRPFAVLPTFNVPTAAPTPSPPGGILSEQTITSGPPPGGILSEQTIIIIVGAGCGTLVLVIIVIVVACVLVRTKRPTNSPTSPVSPALASPPTNIHYPKPPPYTTSPGVAGYPNPGYEELKEPEPYYSEIDLKAMGLPTNQDGVAPPEDDDDGGYLHPDTATRNLNPYINDIYLSHVNLPHRRY